MQIKQFFSPEAIGYSFMRLWSVVMFSSSLLFMDGSYTESVIRPFHDVSLISLIVVLLCVPLLMRLSVFGNKRSYSAIALVSIELGTALAIAGLAVPSFPFILTMLGSVLTGIGSSMLVLFWGCAYSTVPEKRALTSTIGAVALGSVFCLGLAAISYPLLCVLVVACPLASFLFLRDDFLAANDKFDEYMGGAAKIPNRGILISTLGASLGFIILVSFVIGAINYLSKMYGFDSDGESLQFSLVIILGLAAIAMLISKIKRAYSTENLLRLSALFTAVFLLLVPFVGFSNHLLWYLATAGTSALRIAVWVFLARMCYTSKISPFVGFGWGWGVHYLGLQAGEFFTRMLFIAYDAEHQALLFMFALALMFLLIISYVVASRPLSKVRTIEESVVPKVRKFDTKIDEIASCYGLTTREGETLKYLAKGYSSKAIQEELYISASTVSAHSSSIYRKTGVHSKEQVAQMVRDWCSEDASI